MATFQAWFEIVIIRDTRSKHEDTDHAMIAVHTGNKTVHSPAKFLGNLNNGFHKVELGLDFDIADDSKDSVRIAISVVNSGHSQHALDKMVQEMGSAVAHSATDDQARQSIIASVISLIGGLLDPDCDGPVVTAVGTVKASKLRKLGLGYANSLHLLHGTDYGHDSHAGCGHNSNYGYSAVIVRKK